MEVVAISPRGYCFGVVNALKIVKEAIQNHPDQQIYILGSIIHNKFVNKALQLQGVISYDDPSKTKEELLESIDNGVVIFSAHGISETILKRAYEKDLIVYNAVCKDVTQTQNVVKDALNKNYDVLYIGKKHHPEAEAMLSISDNILLITSITDVQEIDIKDHTIVTNQTTMSIYDTQAIIDEILKKNSNVKVINELCRATQMRQEALFDLTEFDLVYVVGDIHSNNSNNLANVAKQSNPNVCFIESVLDIKTDDLIHVKKVAVTSGASTPTSITQQVISYLKKFPNVSETDRTIDYHNIL